MATLEEVGQDITGIEGNPYAHIEWGAECNPVIVWNENLRFHIERAVDPRVTAESVMYAIRYDEVMETLVQKKLARLLGDAYDVAVRWADLDPEDGYDFLEVTVWLALGDDGKLDPTMEQSDAFELLWPAVATLFNVSDPGTYGSEYLFDNLTEG